MEKTVANPMTYEQQMALSHRAQAQSHRHLASAYSLCGNHEYAAEYLRLADSYEQMAVSYDETPNFPNPINQTDEE